MTGRGRRPTGRTTKVLGVRLSLADHAEVIRRAEKSGYTTNRWMELLVKREIAWRPGEGTRRRMAREQAQQMLRGYDGV